ncbi:GNAT family N-acetyltransferase [Pullulanibacillus sp. KACC 23026]|uniref:GNAT family N-acetyltransferase n=1 Tax=Pullulanibacillus sp. KACC 23026 TaxID=3028315 RepID=UPI0023B12F91|nr:GNAT family N-acetyltransferase [Pullulanibacillus sp. KACC 23026]WEG14742.1 GNAT family N-acetyltransferase [Pullulanibacillus sp. KACC 23026]
MITYRTYQSGDETSIVSLWNTCLETDPINLKRFRRLILLDANFDPEGLQVALDGEQLVGALYGLCRKLPMYETDLEEENGWITFFFVSPDYWRQGIATTLLEKAVQFFKKQNRKTIFFSSYAPNYIVPGIDKEHYPEAALFLENQGFTTVYPCVAMDRNLVDFKMSDEVKRLLREREKEGYVFRKAKDGDLYKVIQFANEVFNPDWGRAIREGIPQGLPLERIWVIYNHDRLVGFCLHGGYEGVPDRFGPFGVDPDEQGKKLGKILLNLCLYSMKAEGLHGAWFLWTGETSPAGHLYKKTGFEVTRKFYVVKKLL